MNARQRLIDFVRESVRTPEKQYRWQEPGDVEHARQFVHRMRVELSNLRNAARVQKRQIRPFKMLVEAFQFDVQLYVTTVVIRYSLESRTSVLTELEDLSALVDHELLAKFDKNPPASRPVINLRKPANVET